ncbi:MAG: DUF3090 domain-containing protein [Thermomicrobiales bacterium]|nr:DUF3090 domain-containing protein [Thermomicrobiales bacterium]MCO5219325.1 DUF3090 domain-containing protein [Thermomicrobiales bacterium]MCO5225885.1 DUF3090 domain-containing protein [Thermomicrobiales bacterium]MCO5227581.1 DUF3090 domain-containing protein [Thermomicrobiales bacterium]
MQNPGEVPGGDAQLVVPQAIGEPGKRRFRIVAVINGLTWILWMEKQQVQALGLAMEQILEYIPSHNDLPDWALPTPEIDEHTDLQFRVGRIEMGFDAGDRQVVIAAHDIQDEDMHSAPDVRFRFPLQMARAFAEAASELMNKGRPLCPMCGMPKDEEHVCPEQNGHLPYDLDDPFVDLT